MDALVGSGWTSLAVFAGLVLVALAHVLLPLQSRTRSPACTSASDAAVKVLRARALELRAEHDAGLLDDAGLVAAERELARRALEEAPYDDARSERPPPRYVTLALAMSFPVCALALYALLGEPETARAAAALDGRGPPTANELRSYLARHPRDGRAWVLLAREETRAERYAEGADAFARAVELPRTAGDPTVWCEYADALGMAQGRSLLGRPTVLIERALALAPDHAQALELAGSAAYERGDFGATLRYWRALQARLDPQGSAARELAVAIARVERLAGTAGAVASTRAGR